MDENLRLLQRVVQANSSDLETVFTYIRRLERLVGMPAPPERPNRLGYLIANSRQNVNDLELCNKIHDSFNAAVRMQMDHAGIDQFLVDIDTHLKALFDEHGEHSWYNKLLVYYEPEPYTPTDNLIIRAVMKNGQHDCAYDFGRGVWGSSRKTFIPHIIPIGYHASQFWTCGVDVNDLNSLKLRIGIFEHLLNVAEDSPNPTNSC